MRQPYSLLARTTFFIGFDAFRVRLEPYAGPGVHALASREVDFCETGPLDRNSVKSCATVVNMRQKQNTIVFRRGSQLACKANCWTGYMAPARTRLMSNHSSRAASR